MIFSEKGPNIPLSLVNATEEGRVVFFCGAGISYDVGLVNFEGLVKKVVELSGLPLERQERLDLGQQNFDRVLHSFEQRLPGRRNGGELRKHIFNSLKLEQLEVTCTGTHNALLELSKNRQGITKLVTTNFDRAFEHIASKTNNPHKSYIAPTLPIPKDSSWNGVVYLHGLLPEHLPDRTGQLESLVVTSGDFGLAYLYDAWASRFIHELFRNYEVCFVGYSIADPVMRYVVDALSTMKSRGERVNKAYCFVEESEQEDWPLRAVEKISYSAIDKQHSNLHETLQAWARIHTKREEGKEVILTENVDRLSLKDKIDGVFAETVCWVVADSSGVPAKLFSELNPKPSWQWVNYLFKSGEFCPNYVQPNSCNTAQVTSTLCIKDALFLTSNPSSRRLSKPVHYIARWIASHWQEPEMFWWAYTQHGFLHDQLKFFIETKIASDIDSNDENPIETGLIAAWRLLLQGEFKNSNQKMFLGDWNRDIKRFGVDFGTISNLRKLLSPKVKLRSPSFGVHSSKHSVGKSSLSDYFDFEIVFQVDYVRTAIRERGFLPDPEHRVALLNTFEDLLRDTLLLIDECNTEEKDSVLSWQDLRSIEPHKQNDHNYSEWVALIELVRDSWDVLNSTDKVKACDVAVKWWQEPYVTFKRLALYAATKNDLLGSSIWLEWIVSNEADILFSHNTKREVCRLLATEGAKLSAEELETLTKSILNPPSESEDLVSGEIEYEQWLRLKKLELSGANLAPEICCLVVGEEYEISDNQSEEFNFYISEGWNNEIQTVENEIKLPSTISEIESWTEQLQPRDLTFGHEGNWRGICRNRPIRSMHALLAANNNESTDEQLWNIAFQEWSELSCNIELSHVCKRYLGGIPDEALSTFGSAWWFDKISQSNQLDDKTILYEVGFRILEAQLKEASFSAIEFEYESQQSISHFFNTHFGLIARGFLSLWTSTGLSDEQGIDADFKEVFNRLCEHSSGPIWDGVFMLSLNATTLYRVDPKWAEEQLIPLFSREQRSKALLVWRGYCLSRRWYGPLNSKIWPSVWGVLEYVLGSGEEDTTSILKELTPFLSYIAILQEEPLRSIEFITSFKKLSEPILTQCLRDISMFAGRLESKDAFWQDKFEPFWKNVWPNSSNLVSEENTETLIDLVLGLDACFPKAVELLRNWFTPISYPELKIRKLEKSCNCKNNPKGSLHVLDNIIKEGADLHEVRFLNSCLDKIAESMPELVEEQAYRRLRAQCGV